MTADATPTDRQAIKQLRAKYCHYFDAQDVNNWMSLFAEGATISAGDFGEFTGAEELSLFIDGAFADDPYMSHRVDNPIIDIDGDTATGKWYFEAVQRDRSDGATIRQGRYDERYVRTAEGWKFDRIDIEFDAAIQLGDADIAVDLL